MTIFLTESDLQFLTGYKQPAAQIRWLQKWRIRHTVASNGHPRVTAASLEGSEKPASAPHFAHLRKVG